MKEAFEKIPGRAPLRCGMNLLLDLGAQSLLAGGVLAAGVVLSERFFAAELLTPATVAAFCLVPAVITLVRWLPGYPGRMPASLLLDEPLGLKERFSTTLVLSDCESPFARAEENEESIRPLSRHCHLAEPTDHPQKGGAATVEKHFQGNAPKLRNRLGTKLSAVCCVRVDRT